MGHWGTMGQEGPRSPQEGNFRRSVVADAPPGSGLCKYCVVIRDKKTGADQAEGLHDDDQASAPPGT
jgi:hypothetical protein